MIADAYAQRYQEMSDGELAQIASSGVESLNKVARQQFEAELQRRGLSEGQLVREYPSVARRQPTVVEARPKLFALHRFSLAGVKRWQLAIVLLSLAAVLLPLFASLRAAKMQRLFDCAVFNCGTTDARIAFEQLATYHGDSARRLIVRIATANEWNFSGNQEAAIKVLSEHGNAETTKQLLPLLRPYQGLTVRHAVADALLRLPCSAECVSYVLDYEERTWRDEPAPEHFLLRERSPDIEKERDEVDQQLIRMLLREHETTMNALVLTHGLGTIAVSPYPLHFVRQARLMEACDFLDVNKHDPPSALEQEYAPNMAEQRRKIYAVRSEINCPH